MRLTKKIARIEVDQNNQSLYYAAEIEKCASANAKLSKIIQNLRTSISNMNLTKNNQSNKFIEDNNNLTRDELLENSTVILPQTEWDVEPDYDEEMKGNDCLSDSKPEESPNKNKRPKGVPIDDLKLKIMAFENDFKLPLNGAVVHITSLFDGVDIANGYERVVADGESLWLELSETQIFKSKFQKRQLTRTRQYFTLNGVTLHKQLAQENQPYPRRQKLAVKIDRAKPSSKLKNGKYYLHVHQIKIYNPEIGTRWLGTGRLIRKLVNAFGNKYHPKHKIGSNQTPTSKANYQVVQRKPQILNQTPVLTHHRNRNLYSNYANVSLPPQQQPLFAAPFIHPSRPDALNRGFFPVPVQQGMG